LSDVFSSGVVQPEPISRTTAEQFASSRWFTRGWTLQELLAPASVVFYLQDWTMYGTKSFFKDEISCITGIPAVTTTKPNSLSTFSVAQRISWVSNRQTTRPEDLSYCLLGILGVHMPLLYGEGNRAFIRLQEEVIKVGNDPTIFAWLSSATPKLTSTTAPADNWESPLAPSPKCFINAGKTKRSLRRDKQYGPWFITNFGIHIERLPMLKSTEAEPVLAAAGFIVGHDREFANVAYAIALLGCYRADEDDESVDKQYGLALFKRDDIYYRFRMRESLLLLDSSVRMSEIVNCILHISHEWRFDPPNLSTWVIRQLPEEIHGFNISAILGWSRNSGKESYRHLYVNDLASNETNSPLEAIIFSNDVKKEEFYVVVRYLATGPWPWISIFTNTSRDDLMRQCGWPYINTRLAEYEDQASAPLGDGKEVLAMVVRGVKDGERVFYLDVSIRDIG
jgi:hypothetical protein